MKKETGCEIIQKVIFNWKSPFINTKSKKEGSNYKEHQRDPEKGLTPKGSAKWHPMTLTWTLRLEINRLAIQGDWGEGWGLTGPFFHFSQTEPCVRELPGATKNHWGEFKVRNHRRHVKTWRWNSFPPWDWDLGWERRITASLILSPPPSQAVVAAMIRLEMGEMWGKERRKHKPKGFWAILTLEVGRGFGSTMYL